MVIANPTVFRQAALPWTLIAFIVCAAHALGADNRRWATASANELSAPVPASISSLTPLLNPATAPRVLSGKIKALTKLLLEELTPGVRLCFDTGTPGAEADAATASLTGLRTAAVILRAQASGVVVSAIDQLIPAIDRRMRLLKSNRQTFCIGTWDGVCQREDGVREMKTTLVSTLPGSVTGWQWRVNQATSIAKLVPATASVTDGSWTFNISPISTVIGDFEYSAKDDTQYFRGVLTLTTDPSVTFQCSLSRVRWGGK
jgi:hypothetical protein